MTPKLLAKYRVMKEGRIGNRHEREISDVTNRPAKYSNLY